MTTQMCAVSEIYMYGRDRMPLREWTIESWRKYQQLLRVAEEFDTLTNQPDCPDPAKAEWMKTVEDRIKKLEQRVDRSYNCENCGS